MQRGRVQDGADAGEAAPDGRAVADRRGHRCERGAKQVEADDLTAAGAQDADERLTQMPGAASYQNPLARHTGNHKGGVSAAGHAQGAGRVPRSHGCPPAASVRGCSGTVRHLEVWMTADASEPERSEDEVKRKFREALERKRAKQAETGDGRGGKDSGKVHGAHGPAHQRRSFRRRGGG